MYSDDSNPTTTNSPHINLTDMTPVEAPGLEEETNSVSTDPRHQRRISLMQALFAYTFTNSYDQVDPEFVDEVKDIVADLPEINQLLQAVAPERPLEDINKVDLAILQLIMFESRHKKTPKKVLLDEAVELAKEFGTESSSGFVNGVLGKLLI
jgi:N utilization substance protein B